MLNWRHDEELSRTCRTIPELAEVLCGEARFDIMRALAMRPMNVTELMHELGLKQSWASQSLSVLRRATLVSFEQQKKDRLYRLNGQMQASIEGGVVSLCLLSGDGDSLSIRSKLPFVAGHEQTMLWKWAVRTSAGAAS